VLAGRREVDRQAGAGVDQFEKASRGLRPGAEERQSMSLRNDQARGQQGDAPRQCVAEEPVGISVMLVAPAA
jgi:hypothetical protein